MKSTDDVYGHTHANLQTKVEEEILQTLNALASTRQRRSSTELVLDEAARIRKELDSQVVHVQQEITDRTTFWDDQLSAAKKQLEQCEKDVSNLSEAYRVSIEMHQEALVAASSLESQISVEKEAARYARETFSSLRNELALIEEAVDFLKAEIKEQQNTAKEMSRLTDAFGNRGVQTFVLQNAVRDLQALTQTFLDDFSDGALRLQLSLDAGDRISRKALVREPDGTFKERPLATLSGGQWRRCSLALNLGFADLVARKGQLCPSLIVFDEPLTHLDRAGRADVGKVLRKILGRSTVEETGDGASHFAVSTIIIILQDLAAEELEEVFDRIDLVVKENGSSFVQVDETSY
jgi:DNA repair exonuclease SbcCD ATPase subunit